MKGFKIQRIVLSVAVLTCGVLTACGGDDGTTSDTVSTEPVATESTVPEDTTVESTAVAVNLMTVAEFCDAISAQENFFIDLNSITEQQMLDQQAEYAGIIATLPAEVPDGVRSDVELIKSFIDKSIDYFASLGWDNAKFSFTDWQSKSPPPFTFELGPWTRMNCA